MNLRVCLIYEDRTVEIDESGVQCEVIIQDGVEELHIANSARDVPALEPYFEPVGLIAVESRPMGRRAAEGLAYVAGPVEYLRVLLGEAR